VALLSRLGKLAQLWVKLRSKFLREELMFPEKLENREIRLGTLIAEGALERVIATLKSCSKEKEIMKNTHLRKFGVGATVFILIFVFILVSGSAQTEVKFVDAASYYKDAKCMVCHGPKADKKFNTELKDEELVEFVLKGKKVEKPPHMPAYEPKGITAEQAKALVDHMKGLKAAP
jgi:hypothetical protein